MKSFTKDHLKVAIIQHPPVYMNLEKSVEKVIQYAEEAHSKGSRLIVFPETWLPGYPLWLDYAPEAAIWDHPGTKALYRMLSDNSICIGDSYFERIRDLAKRLQLYLIIGVNERSGNTIYNTIIYFNPDGTHKIHRKLTPTYTERLVWGVGDGSTLTTIDTEFGTIGAMICWEHWMPLTRAAYHAQHETVHIAQWPYVKDLHLNASRNYAFEGQCFVLASGCVMTKQDMLDGINSNGESEITELAAKMIESIPVEADDFVLKGGSAVIKPNHELQVEPLFDTPSIIYSEINLNETTDGHLILDTDGHYSRPDVFTLNVDTRSKKNVTFD